MMRRIAITAGALALLAVTSVSAQHSNSPPVAYYPDGRAVVLTEQAATWPNTPYEISGVVRWVQPSSLTLDDGRHIWIDERTHVTVGGSPVMLSTLRPGAFVIIRSSRPMAMRKNAPVASVPIAPPAPIVGTVSRFEQPNYIVLMDGRVIPANANTLVLVNDRSVPVTMLQPGTPVTIYPNGPGAEYPSAMPTAIQPR